MLRWFEKHNKIACLITIIIAILIFYMSSLTSKQTPGNGSSKNTVFYHIAAFFFFALFLGISIIKGKNKKFLFLPVVISIFYGISDEFHQFFVPGRSCSFSDVLLDTTGILLASLFYTISLKNEY